MRNESHSKTLIAVVLEHVNAWRKREAWSRETVVAAIVEAHEGLGGPVVSGIRFEPQTLDSFERMKVNADRVFRWLDDATKDGNLLPSNFIASILAAMPLDVRLACVDDLLLPVGLSVRPLAHTQPGALDAVMLLKVSLKEDSETERALADLITDQSPEALRRARLELIESRDAHEVALEAIEGALAAGE